MCGLFAAYDSELFSELESLVKDRGSKEKTLCLVDPDQSENYQEILYENLYKIGHIQSPTAVDNPQHPARYYTHGYLSFLWHNGLIKEEYCEVLRKKHQTDTCWDTELLLREISLPQSFSKNLSAIDGSFACLFIRGNQLMMFRNQIAPLYYRDDAVCSVPFRDAEEVPPGKLWGMRNRRWFIKEGFDFETFQMPYYFT